jgi:hypothetical protein
MAPTRTTTHLAFHFYPLYGTAIWATIYDMDGCSPWTSSRMSAFRLPQILRMHTGMVQSCERRKRKCVIFDEDPYHTNKCPRRRSFWSRWGSDHKPRGFKSYQPFIPLLALCWESYNIFSQFYTSAFGTVYGYPETWFDYERDTLYLDIWNPDYEALSWDDPSSILISRQRIS